MPCNSHSKIDKACKACFEDIGEDELRKMDPVEKSTYTLQVVSKALSAIAARSLATATTRSDFAIDSGMVSPALQSVSDAKMQNSLVMHGVPSGRIIPFRIPEQIAPPETAKDYESCPVCSHMVLSGEDCPGCERLRALAGGSMSTDWSR